MDLICLAQKGGMNKTTATVNLAAQFAANGRPGIVVDLDRQQNHAMMYANSIPGVTFTTQWPVVKPDGGFVIVDCSPHIGPALGPALLGADLVLIPSLATLLSLEAVEETAATVSLYRKQKPDLAALVFFSSVRTRLKHSFNLMHEFEEKRSVWPVAKNYLADRTVEYDKAFLKRGPVDSKSKAWEEYARLAREIEELFV